MGVPTVRLICVVIVVWTNKQPSLSETVQVYEAATLSPELFKRVISH
jgi:hypothetical protein